MSNKTNFLAGRLQQLSDEATISGEHLVSECGDVVAEVALNIFLVPGFCTFYDQLYTLLTH